MRNIKLHFTPVGLLVFTYSIIYVLAIYGCSGIHSKFSMRGSYNYEHNGATIQDINVYNMAGYRMLERANIKNWLLKPSENGVEGIDLVLGIINQDILIHKNSLGDNSDLDYFASALRINLADLNNSVNNDSDSQNIEPTKILQLNDWDMRFIKIIKMLFEVNSNPSLVTNLCKSIDQIFSDIVNIRNSSTDPQTLFDLSKHTRCWVLVESFLNYKIVKSVKKNTTIQKRFRQFDNDLNEILDGVFHYKNLENQNKKSKKTVYCILNDYGEKAWSYHDSNHKYKTIYGTNSFSDILVIGNGSRNINEDGITKKVVKILSDMMDKDKDTSIVIECNYHASELEKNINGIEKVLEALLKSTESQFGFNKSDKSRVIIVANGCLSGRFHKHNQEENNQVYLITSTNDLMPSSTLDHRTKDRRMDLAKHINEQDNILDSFLYFYLGHKASTPYISGPGIKTQPVVDYCASLQKNHTDSLGG